MAAPNLIAVIDIGKSNAKVAAFDLATQTEIDRRTTPNKVINTAPYPHYDVEALWNFIINSLRELAAKNAIDAITITTHGASAALLTNAGALAMPVLDYEHSGPEALQQEYDNTRPPFEETGSPRLPNGLNLGAQIYWQEKSFPREFAKVKWLVTYPQYWAFRLCGSLANEVTSLGCHTDLWNYQKRDYSSMVDAQGWRNLMPPLRKASEQLGTLRSDLAKQTGLPQHTPVYCGIHDSNASLYPHLLSAEKSFSVVSTGTWVICMALGASPTKLDAARDCLVNVNVMGQPVPSSRFMGGREFQILSERCSNTPAENKAMLMPSVVHGSGPFPNYIMQWRGEPNLTAASWYLALMTSQCLKLIGAQGPVILEGPFCGNQAYVEMLSAATSREVRVSSTKSTGATQGAALLCNANNPKLSQGNRVSNNDATLKAYAAEWEMRLE